MNEFSLTDHETKESFDKECAPLFGMVKVDPKKIDVCQYGAIFPKTEGEMILERFEAIERSILEMRALIESKTGLPEGYGISWKHQFEVKKDE